jgi:hypothetical protein
MRITKKSRRHKCRYDDWSRFSFLRYVVADAGSYENRKNETSKHNGRGLIPFPPSIIRNNNSRSSNNNEDIHSSNMCSDASSAAQSCAFFSATGIMFMVSRIESLASESSKRSSESHLRMNARLRVWGRIVVGTLAH